MNHSQGMGASNGSNFTSINNFAFFLLATIVLAGINDVDGIIIGGVLGHTICTGLAVIAGALISRKISVRAVTFIGAIGKEECPKNIGLVQIRYWPFVMTISHETRRQLDTPENKHCFPRLEVQVLDVK